MMVQDKCYVSFILIFMKYPRTLYTPELVVIYANVINILAYADNSVNTGKVLWCLYLLVFTMVITMWCAISVLISHYQLTRIPELLCSIVDVYSRAVSNMGRYVINILSYPVDTVLTALSWKALQQLPYKL